MSFRNFVCTCALCGACTALVGWGFGRAVAGPNPLAEAGVKGMFLGMLVALGLGVIEAVWNIPGGLIGKRTASVLTGVLVGSLGGLMGGVIGQFLYQWQHWALFLVLGWTITGLLIGASIGAFSLLAAVLVVKAPDGLLPQNADDFVLAHRLRQLFRGALGGTVGGILGGALAVVFRHAWENAFHDKPSELLWSPSAGGFIALGGCIGLAIALAQVLLQPAWIRVEKGFRPGRERLLSEAETVIGRGESCDVGLFGDAEVARCHARIVRQGDHYVLLDAGAPGGTFVNGERIGGTFFLQSGDRIQVGNSVLVFYERRRAVTV